MIYSYRWVKCTTLLSVLFVPLVNGATAENRIFFDPCQRLARQTFNEQSNCDAATMVCSSLYWESEGKTQIIYRSIGEGFSSELISVTCGESAVFFSPESQRRKRKSAVRGRKPTWFKRDNAPVENIQAGIESVLNILSSELTPVLRIWPLGSIGAKEEQAMSRISRYVKVLHGIEAGEAESAIEAMKDSYREEDSRWLEWVLFVQENDRIGSSARYDREDILVNFYPFAHLHVFIIESLFEVENYLEQDDDGIELTVLPELLRNTRRTPHDRMGALEVEEFFKSFIPRVNDIWAQLQMLDTHPIVEQLGTDPDMYERLEAIVSWISLNEDPLVVMKLRENACPNLLKVEGFIAHITPNRARRATRLILSLVEICKDVTTLTERHRLKALLPEVIAAQTLFVPRSLFLPLDVEAQFEFSLRFLARENLKLNYDLNIRFADSPANGSTGPRTQWLSVMFERIFNPSGRFFKYSDENTKQFLIPNRSMHPDLFFVVGRVIGLGIRYGLTIGARLTPCSLAILRAPLKSFDLETCVAREDAELVSNLRKLELVLKSNDTPAISLIGEEELTLETFPKYMQNVLYEKGIGRIRTSMTLIKRGIRTILPLTALELFTEKEFEEMINGSPSLSPETLWAGIWFLNKREELEYYSTWLKEILTEQSESFRFAFNRFITALPQPPVGKNEPWIWISIDDKPARSNHLPSAQTCSKSLILPLYQDKATLLEKLTKALFEGGNDSLQLC